MAGKADESNYLVAAVGGLFLLAVIVLAAYLFLPSEGCVGVVEISGPLVTQDVPSSLFTDEQKGSQTISDELSEAGGRKDVRAVLLLIDSPGGSVIASQEIYAAVRAMNKTSVTFIREMAASGGYYAAAGTDYIVANPDTLRWTSLATRMRQSRRQPASQAWMLRRANSRASAKYRPAPSTGRFSARFRHPRCSYSCKARAASTFPTGSIALVRHPGILQMNGLKKWQKKARLHSCFPSS